MIIAVDGPAASGKGTLAKRLATHYGLAYLDTGRTYRAVALALMEDGVALDDGEAAVRAAGAIDLGALEAPALATAEVGEGASQVAVLPELRTVLVARQQGFAREAARAGRGAVLDGRDIGTVVLPDASVKLFITAEVEERARRRALELTGSEAGPAYERLLAALRSRDARDCGRASSPLRPAADAHILDTTHLDADAAFWLATRVVDEALAA
ncbi:(d)CMP kinase [Acuticoccus sp.]|uniref:(d)CMP kinase n=1 Tax=Acuticoccus sp. TaxID=1904378 RepID=UPI003B5175C5